MLGMHLAGRINELNNVLDANTSDTHIPRVVAHIAQAYSLMEYPKEAMQALLAAKVDICENKPNLLPKVQRALDYKLPGYSVPEKFRHLPVYPSKRTRLADDVRHMFKTPLTEQERLSLFAMSKECVTDPIFSHELYSSVQDLNKIVNDKMTPALKLR